MPSPDNCVGSRCCLMGCTDKQSARSAIDLYPNTVDEEMSLMGLLHDLENRIKRRPDSGSGGGRRCYFTSEQSPGEPRKVIKCWRIK